MKRRLWSVMIGKRDRSQALYCMSALRLAAVVALVCLFLPIMGGCQAANKNVLIGSWRFSSATGTMNGACQATDVFTEKTWTFTLQTGGGAVTTAVTYNVSPKQIAVINATTGGFATYTLIDKNHVYTESAWGRCIYERTN